MTDVRTPETLAAEEAAVVMAQRREALADVKIEQVANEPLASSSAVEEPALDEATINQLKALGFDHVPTVEEARERLQARRAEIRDEVLFQADRRGWCEEGTREVCAGLRLTRPGIKEARTVTVRFTTTMTYVANTWTDRGALAYAAANTYLPIVNGDRLARRVGGNGGVEVHEVKVNDTVIELTDELRGEIA